MSRIVRCSLIQASNAAPPDASLEDTKQAMIDKHLGLIRQAAWAGALPGRLAAVSAHNARGER